MDYPRMLYGKHPDFIIVASAAEEEQYLAQGYTRASWNMQKMTENLIAKGKPFTCPVCDKRFSTRGSLNTHKSLFHRTPRVKQRIPKTGRAANLEGADVSPGQETEDKT